MSTLIPALNTCVSRMTTGERRLAERLEQKLGSNYLVWYDVPVGPKRLHPDFIVLHPRRGLLVLEVKDWKLDDIRQAGKLTFEVAPEGVPRSVINPLEQSRQYAHQMVAALTQDPQLQLLADLMAKKKPQISAEGLDISRYGNKIQESAKHVNPAPAHQ